VRRSFIALATTLAALCISSVALGRSATRTVTHRPFTLAVARNVHDTNAPNAQFAVKRVNVRENVAVGPNGFAVYTFQGETTHHVICRSSTHPATNCWSFWPPVTVSSSRGLRKESGIAGRLGTFRDQGVLHLTLNGRPLYYFTPDIQSHNRRVATSDETKTFGSIWHIVSSHGRTGHGSSSGTPTRPVGPYPAG